MAACMGSAGICLSVVVWQHFSLVVCWESAAKSYLHYTRSIEWVVQPIGSEHGGNTR